MLYVVARDAAASLRAGAFAIALGFAGSAIAGAATAADIDVKLDQAKLVKLPEKAATVVVGNPMIADATIQPGGLMVITGKGYGKTNMIALDRGGKVLMSSSVEVTGPRADVVVVYRGIDRETYSCAPWCERRYTLGDSEKYFNTTGGQITTRNGMAQSAAPGSSSK
jgi:hypothetical protein